MPQAIIAGLGLPGNLIALALLRQGWRLIVADPKPVTERTLARVYGPADIGKPKTLALEGPVATLGRLDQLDARLGRIEDVVGGQEWRAAELVVLATDRPASTRRVAEICLRLGTTQHPLHLVSCHVAEGAAQVRAFAFPTAGGPCALCGSGDAFISSILNEDGFTCDDYPAGGDAFTVPFGAVEGYAAAALALRAIGGEPGADTTLALGPACEAFNSRLRQDPDCLLDCAHVVPWPEATAHLEFNEPLRPALSVLAATAGSPAGEAHVEFLRPLALGTECACGRCDAPRVHRNPCPTCQAPVVALRGWTSELPLGDLPPQLTAADLGLPEHDLLLLRGAAPLSSEAQDVLTIAVEGGVHK